MESIRKYIGYAAFCAAALAAAVGVIILFTDIAAAFKMINSFGGFIRFGGYWLAKVVCWAGIAVIAVLTVLKMGQLDANKRNDRISLMAGIGALAEFASCLVTLVFAIKNNVAGYLGGKFWVLFIFTILVIAAFFVRRFVFGKNLFVGKIMAAAAAFVMFIVFCLYFDGASTRGIIYGIFWVLAYAVMTAHPLLASPIKE